MLLRYLAAVATLALVASSPLGSPALPPAGDVVTSTAWLPFAGSFFDSVTGEWVDISASLHIVTQTTISPTADTLTLHAALPADIDATGRTTGQRYIANGTTILHLELPPSPAWPIDPTGGILNFVIFPVPHRSTPGDPMFVLLTLRFTSDGTLLVGSSSVRLCGDRVGSCSSD